MCESPHQDRVGERTFQFNVAPGPSFGYSLLLDGFYISGMVAAIPEQDVHLTFFLVGTIEPIESIRPQHLPTTQERESSSDCHSNFSRRQHATLANSNARI